MLISEAIFKTQLNYIEDLLKRVHLDNERNYIKTTFDASDFRKKTYKESWQTYIHNNFYDFLLNDSSILVFKNDITKGSYIYFECPYDCLTYEEFGEHHEFTKHEDYWLLYYDYLTECELKEAPLMIRYDYDDSSYIEGYHPASHFHIGFNNNTRIGIPKVINPMTFLLFILRQHYNSKWHTLINSEFYKSKFEKIYAKHKDNDNEVDNRFWKNLDLSELFLV